MKGIAITVRRRVLALALAAIAFGGLTASAAAAPGDVTVTQVANINASSGSNPDKLTNVNGTLFFAANDGSNGQELYKSAPPYTTATMVENINTGNPAGNNAALSSQPTFLTDVNGTLFFAALDGINGYELWKSAPPYDAGSTSLVANVNPAGDAIDTESGAPFAAIGGTLFFPANNGNGKELWKSNGGALGPGGTEIVSDIAGTGGSNPTALTDVNGTLFFAADDGGTVARELWKSVAPYGDGQTDLVANIKPGDFETSSPASLTNVNGTLFFTAEDNDATNGQELWKSNGGPLGMGGTEMVKNINPTAGFDSNSQKLINVGGTLFFQANDGTNGVELWKSNGTDAGTTMVANINTGDPAGSAPSADSTPQALLDVNGTLYFKATNSINGYELWRSNGGLLGAGTEMIADLNPGTGSGVDSSSSAPANFGNIGGTVFFPGSEGSCCELYRTTGTGASLVADINPTSGSTPERFTSIGDTLFFTANDGTTGQEAWKATIEGPAPPGTGPGTSENPACAVLRAKLKKAKSKRKKKKIRKKLRQLGCQARSPTA